MSYTIKLPNEQKWLTQSFDLVMPHEFKAFRFGFEALKETHLTNSNKLPLTVAGAELKGTELENYFAKFESSVMLAEKLWTDMETIAHSVNGSKYKKDSQYLFINFPQKKTCTNLKDAYKGDEGFSPSEPFQAQLKFFENAQTIQKLLAEYVPLYTALPGNPTPGSWDHESLELRTSSFILKAQGKEKQFTELKKLAQSFVKIGYEIESKTAENTLLNKTAWAIFEQHPGQAQAGYIDKNGSTGEISAARLFDSDSGALKTAKSKRLTPGTYEIVEVEIAFKKRTHLANNFQGQALDELAAILEKQKLESFFQEMGLDTIEAKLNELKTQTKKNKI